MAKDLEKVEGDNLPERSVPTVDSLYDEVSISDIKPPLILLQEPLSTLAKAGITKSGDVVLAFGSDDPSPTFLIGGPDKRDSFVAYIIGRQKFAATTIDGQVVHHPDNQRDHSDPNSWEGFYYDVALPEFDDVLPARLRLWRTAGGATARSINTMMERAAHGGGRKPLAVKFTVTQKRSRQGGHTFNALQAAPTLATEEGLVVAERLQVMALELRRSRGFENDAPEGNAQPAFS